MLRARDAYAGGMQWLTVKGREYLTRYRYDPVSGDKKAVSLGPDPETEKIYDAFIKERSELDGRIAELRSAVAERARMAKALRLSRAPSEVGSVLRAIGTSDLIDHVTLVGEAAIYAYENEMTSQLPREVLPDEGLDLLVAGVRVVDSIDELIAVLRRAKIPVRPGRARGQDAAELRTEENLAIRLFTSSSVDRMVDDYESYSAGQAPRWASEQAPIRSVVIDRSGRAASVSVLEPRAWAILRCIIWSGRSADGEFGCIPDRRHSGDLGLGSREMKTYKVDLIADVEMTGDDPHPPALTAEVRPNFVVGEHYCMCFILETTPPEVIALHRNGSFRAHVVCTEQARPLFTKGGEFELRSAKRVFATGRFREIVSAYETVE